MKKAPNTSNKVDGLGNVDQIREIIFGSQMRELDQRFGGMEKRLEEMKNSFETQVRELKQVMQSEMNSSIELLETKLKNLGNLSKEEREALREELLRTDKRLNMALDSMTEEHDTKLSLMKKDQQNEMGRIKSDLAELRQNVSRELEERLSSMGEMKVSRDAMAEVLLDMAMKIKGEGLDIALNETGNE